MYFAGKIAMEEVLELFPMTAETEKGLGFSVMIDVSGYKRFGLDCHQICPQDFRDDGLLCRKTEYGRGSGYPWRFGDRLNDNGMRSRC